MAALLLPEPRQGRAFQIVTKTHCGPKSLSNFVTPPFRPIIYLVFQGNAAFFYRVVGSLNRSIARSRFASIKLCRQDSCICICSNRRRVITNGSPVLTQYICNIMYIMKGYLWFTLINLRHHDVFKSHSNK